MPEPCDEVGGAHQSARSASVGSTWSARRAGPSRCEEAHSDHEDRHGRKEERRSPAEHLAADGEAEQAGVGQPRERARTELQRGPMEDAPPERDPGGTPSPERIPISRRRGDTVSA